MAAQHVLLEQAATAATVKCARATAFASNVSVGKRTFAGNSALAGPFGLEIMFGIFPLAKNRCDLNRGRSYTKDNFLSQMEPLKDIDIVLPGAGQIALDWQRTSMAVISNTPGRNLIIRHLSDVLRAADEEDVGVEARA